MRLVQRSDARNSTINKEQVKGAAREVGGKIQQKVRELTGGDERQLKGLRRQVEGKVKQQIGNLKEAVDDLTDQRAALPPSMKSPCTATEPRH